MHPFETTTGQEAEPAPLQTEPELVEAEETQAAEPAKKRRKAPSKEEFARVIERVALVMRAEAVAVSPALGSGKNAVFITLNGQTSMLDGVPLMTRREVYSFLQGLAYPRPSDRVLP